ncbi:hypothetical protein, partial [Pseudomonas viridiflava]|uniref:hypothetical protein n=1 Tax=Pseudomonas viridiflava TaxID=33069 RepID=UPI0019D16926
LLTVGVSLLAIAPGQTMIFQQWDRYREQARSYRAVFAGRQRGVKNAGQLLVVTIQFYDWNAC